MLVGALGVVLWLIVWAPWARSRRTVYRREVLNVPAYPRPTRSIQIRPD